MWARVWKTFAAAEEALKAEVCSFGEPRVGVNLKGSLENQSSMPQMPREVVEVIQPVLVERIKGRVADQMVDIPVPPVMEEIVAALQEVVRRVPQERLQLPTVEVVLAPTEQVQRRTVDVPTPQVLEETVDVVRLVP